MVEPVATFVGAWGVRLGRQPDLGNRVRAAESKVLHVNPTLPLSSHVSLGKSFTFSHPQVLICKGRITVATSLEFVETRDHVCRVSRHRSALS